MYWRSLITGERYLYSEYACVEKESRGFLPLPKEGYPWTIEIDKQPEIEPEMMTITRTEYAEFVAKVSAFDIQCKLMIELDKIIDKNKEDLHRPYYEMLLVAIKEKRIK